MSELVNVMARDTQCELVCKRAKLSPLRRDSVSRPSCGCVTERNCLPSSMSHVLARVRDVLIEFTVNTNLPFRTAKSFQLLEIWTNPTIREAAFHSPRNNGRLLPSIMPYTIETVWLPQDHMSESSVLYSLHVLHSKQQTHHDSRHWPRLCTGSVSDSHQRLTTAVVRGCNHFQMLFFCGRTNK